LSIKVALIFRGPPGTGKSSLIDSLSELLKNKYTIGIINLDQQWLIKSSDNRERYYPDLSGLTSDIVFIEVAYAGNSTKNPKHWCDVLRVSSYKIRSFFLDTDMETCVKRVKARKDNLTPKEVRTYWKKDHMEPFFKGFALRANVKEVIISTDHREIADIANEILKDIGL
jgi:thymidylate kinase